MAGYMVFTDYRLEGWRISYQGDDFKAAVNAREAQLSYGNERVIIVKEVELEVTEKECKP